MIDEELIDMPQTIDQKYYFLLGLIQGAVEVGLLWNDNPLFDGVIQMLESSPELNEEEQRILECYKELKSRPLPTPF